MGKPQGGPAGTTGEQKEGLIKRLVMDKGFGFVRTANGNEYFFHRTGVLKPGFEALSEGDKVQFLVGEASGKGLRAENVERI